MVGSLTLLMFRRFMVEFASNHLVNEAPQAYRMDTVERFGWVDTEESTNSGNPRSCFLPVHPASSCNQRVVLCRAMVSVPISLDCVRPVIIKLCCFQ